MKNIQVGDVVKTKYNKHRYIVDDVMGIGEVILKSIIDEHMIDDFIADLELVEGIERVQRGDVVEDEYGTTRVAEVLFNSFAVYDGDTLQWVPFERARYWKIVGKVEDRQGPPEVKLEWRGKPKFEDQKCEYCSKEAHKTYLYNGSVVAWLCDKHDKKVFKSPEADEPC